MLENLHKIIYDIANLLLKRLKGGIGMTNSDIILRLIEMLLAERDKNYQLREDNKKGKTNT